MAIPAIFGRIGVRLVLFLTLALLPLGLIAVWQTVQVMDGIEEREDLTLVALTHLAASAERRVIERSFGAAEVLADIAAGLRDDPEACAQLMRDYLVTSPQHSFAGFLPRDGLLVCSSSDQTHDLSGTATFEQMMAEPRRRVTVPGKGVVSGQPVITVNEPVYADGEFVGYVGISTPRGLLKFEFNSIRPAAPLSLVTFTEAGDIIAANGPLDALQSQLPARLQLAELAQRGAATFEAEDRNGKSNLYAVAAIVPNVAYAIGRWAGPGVSGAAGSTLPAYAFPIVMWLASLAVAYFAVHRVVIKHIRALQSEMRGFALHRHLGVVDTNTTRPTEFAEMHRTFVRTASVVLRDEAELENALHEQKVLLKEVHHRVKNNLQLISSITSMQIRNVSSPEARAVLRRLQERVLGLAAIHRHLYQSDALSQVRIDGMLAEILSQVGRGALPGTARVETRLHADPVSLYPDQVVPLSLLAAEALTNALKHVGRTAGGEAWVEVRLSTSGDDTVTLTVSNTRGEPVLPPGGEDAAMLGDGLGERLIRAFAGQLSGDLRVEETESLHALHLSFKRASFSEAPADAEAAE